MAAASTTEVVTLGPPRRFGLPSARSLWSHRDLIYLLARRDVAVRYKQTAVGAAWAVLQPVMLAVVFSLFFGVLADVPSQAGIEYPIYALSGLVLWLFFVNAMTRASTCTVTNVDLIAKVYFPRSILPIAAVLAPVVDLAVGLAVVVIAMLGFGYVPTLTTVLVPLICVLAFALALGAGLWLSALYVRYRDVNLVLPFLVLVGMAITPIIYPLSLVPESVQWVYSLNPMVGTMELYRWALFAESPFPEAVTLVPLLLCPVLLVSGLAYFRHAEQTFADII